MSTFITGCVEDQVDENKEEVKQVKPVRIRRPQSHWSGSSSKKTQLKEDRAFQIFKENQILMKKMIYIDSKPSNLSFRYFSAQNTSKSKARVSQQLKIAVENQRYVQRLKNTTSHYSIDRFEQETRFRQRIRERISKKKLVKADKKRGRLSLDQELIERILKRREIRIEKTVDYK